MTILQVNSHSIDQKSGEIWTGQALLQPISFKSDRLLGANKKFGRRILVIYKEKFFVSNDVLRHNKVAV